MITKKQNEKTMWNRAAMTYFEVLLQHMPAGIEEIHKNLQS
jgi:hypothetical protein